MKMNYKETFSKNNFFNILFLVTVAVIISFIGSNYLITGIANAKEESKVLIVYYSRSNNTEVFAQQIQQQIGGDLLRLQTINPYPSDYNSTTRQAKEELESGFKPPLQAINIDIKDYDTIYIGSPCWWGTIAPPVITFLSEQDFSGKTIIPFSTHEGTGIGRTVTDIKKLAPNATVLDGLAVRGSSVRNAQNDITNWLKRLAQI